MMMNDELLHACILKWHPNCFLPCVSKPPGSWLTTPLWPTLRSSPQPWGKPGSSPTTSLWAWGKYQEQIPILKCSHTRRCLHFHSCLRLTLTLMTLLFTSTCVSSLRPARVTNVFYEQYLTIVPEGLFIISLCLLPTFVVCCLLLGLDLRSGLLNLLTIIMITVDTVGVMTLWGIDYNAVALINLVTVSTDWVLILCITTKYTWWCHQGWLWHKLCLDCKVWASKTCYDNQRCAGIGQIHFYIEWWSFCFCQRPIRKHLAAQGCDIPLWSSMVFSLCDI